MADSLNSLSKIPLKVGMLATLENVSYEIVGRSRWKMFYKEYYKEENSSGYSTEHWIYDEWLLKDYSDNYVYLVEDIEGFKLSEKIDPELKPILEKRDNTFTEFYHRHKQSRVIEYGESEITYLEGAVEDDAEIGQIKDFFTYFSVGDNAYFSLEMYHGDLSEDREYYKDKKISRKTILEAFANYPEIKAIKEEADTLRLGTMLSFFAFVATLVMFIMSFYTKKLIYEHTIPLDSLSNSTAYRTPAWEIKELNQLYYVELKMKFTALTTFNSLHEVSVDADVYEEKEGIVNTLLGDFYHETGRDSDGAWTETSTISSLYVRGEKAGKFYAEMYGERMPVEIEGDITLSVRTYWFAWYYTLTAMIIFLITWIVFAIMYHGMTH